MVTRSRLKRSGSKAKKTQRLKRAKDIDVFWHLEEVLIKKDLDDRSWYRARTNRMILGFVNSLRNELVGFVESGEGISKEVAEKAVDLFEKDIERELKKDPKDKPVDVQTDVGIIEW
jgi:hypothetical protein